MGEQEDISNVDTLVISEHTNPDKIERHIGPLAAVTDKTTMVCLTPNEDVDLNYVQVPSLGHRLVGIGILLLVATIEVVRSDYDVVVSFSLFPYGIFALIVGTVTCTPTHLGILGADLDVHAHAWYRLLPRTLFTLFDSISVLGPEHKRQLVQYGMRPEDIFILTNAIDIGVYCPERRENPPTYDFVWSGRLAPEKDPLLFVEAINKLRLRGYDVRAVMLGSGELQDAVSETVSQYGLTGAVELTGWVDNPEHYYAKSEIFVLTSEREALGLSLLESMAMGLACIAPRVGNIPNITNNMKSALLVDQRTVGTFADTMERLIVNEALRERLAANAVSVGRSFSYENARDDWRDIIGHSVQ